MSGTMLTVLLALIVVLVLILPLTVHKVEENLEAFLFIMGVCAVTLSGVWSGHLVLEAAKDPIPITLAVLVLGFVFKTFNRQIKAGVTAVKNKVGLKVTLFLAILLLGLFSSIITAILAAVVLSEITNIIGLKGDNKAKFIVVACFAIGMGAVLTPIGEPLSTIVVSKLKGAPHNADFFFLLKMLGFWIIPGVIALSFLAFFIKEEEREAAADIPVEKNKDLVFRAGKVYLFVGALVFLGKGLTPLAEKTIFKLSDGALYWVNSISAILDNATLAAIEIVPTMTDHKIKFLLIGLTLAGGMLVPGNIPNIICASKLKIKSSTWAKYGIPLGAVLMVVYFALLKLVG